MKSNKNKRKYFGFISKNNVRRVNASLLSSLLAFSFTLNTPRVSAEQLTSAATTASSTTSSSVDSAAASTADNASAVTTGTSTSADTSSTDTNSKTSLSTSSVTTPAAVILDTPNSSGDPMVLTMDSAIKMAIDNNITIKQMNNNADLSVVQRDAYSQSTNDLLDANRTVSGGFNKFNDAQNQFISESAAATTALNNAISPTTFTTNKITGKDVTFNKGDSIPAVLTANGVPATQVKVATQQVIEGIKAALQTKAESATSQLKTAQNTVSIGNGNLEAAKRVIASALSGKLNITELNSLNTQQTSDLLNKMAGAAYLVNTAAKDIARNKIVLLVQKDYYDILKAKHLVSLKEESMNRGQTQYNMAKASYEVGAKSKDDMLLASIYYTSTQLEYQKAQADYENALLTLKKDLNVPLNTNLSLNDVYTTETTSENLNDGIKTGMEKRIEIIKANATYEVYKLDLDLVDSAYGSDSDRHKEAEILLENMDLERTKTKNDVEGSIRQSYENYMLVQSMLKTSKDMVAQAKESLEIAHFKYDEGFNGDSTLMTKLDLQASTGTMLEVIAAEENLATVQEKYEEILYNFNLAKSNYYNDICNLKY